MLMECNLGMDCHQTFNESGLPPDELCLNICCSLILLQNLAPGHGLCNGTWMVLQCMLNRVLEVRIIGGDNDGEVTFIPCITLNTIIKNTRFVIYYEVEIVFCSVSINNDNKQGTRAISKIYWVGSSSTSVQPWLVVCGSLTCNKPAVYQSSPSSRYTRNDHLKCRLFQGADAALVGFSPCCLKFLINYILFRCSCFDSLSIIQPWAYIVGITMGDVIYCLLFNFTEWCSFYTKNESMISKTRAKHNDHSVWYSRIPTTNGSQMFCMILSRFHTPI